jgi:hypothetical protein
MRFDRLFPHMADDRSWDDLFANWPNLACNAHPDSPLGACGSGISRPPAPLGCSWSTSLPFVHPDSPASRYCGSFSVGPVIFDPAIVLEILHADSLGALETIAQSELNKSSFNLGFIFGVGEGGWELIEGSIELLRMLVLNGMYEQIHEPPGSWYDPVYQVRRLENMAWDYLLHDHLEAAHSEVEQLITELRWIVSNLRDFFVNVWNQELEEYSGKWQNFQELMSNPGIANSFHAGRIAGLTMLEVVLLLSTFVDGAGLALKGIKAARDLPELTKLARKVKRKSNPAGDGLPKPRKRPAPGMVMYGPFQHYVDELGRPLWAEGPLQTEGSVRKPWLQEEVSGPFNKDQKGLVNAAHLIARWFGGSPELYNLVPLGAFHNQGVISDFEKLLHARLQTEDIWLRVEAVYTDTKDIPARLIYRVYESTPVFHMRGNLLEVKEFTLMQAGPIPIGR